VTRFEYQQFGARANALRGERLPHSKLKQDDVRRIRQNIFGKTAKQLADEFGVHYRTVEKVLYYETWSHIK